MDASEARQASRHQDDAEYEGEEDDQLEADDVPMDEYAEDADKVEDENDEDEEMDDDDEEGSQNTADDAKQTALEIARKDARVQVGRYCLLCMWIIS